MAMAGRPGQSYRKVALFSGDGGRGGNPQRCHLRTLTGLFFMFKKIGLGPER